MVKPVHGILVLLVLGGCATQHGTVDKPRQANLNEVPLFQRVTLVPQETFTAVGRGESQGSRASKGVVGGALAGTGAGAVIGASACAATGPFAPACFAYYMSMGMMAGGAAGSLYGLTGLSREDQTAVNRVLSKLSQERDFQEELEGAVLAGSGDICVLNEEAAVQLVTVLDTIEIKQSTPARVRLVFAASMQFTWEDPEQGTTTARETYEVTSVRRSLDGWLMDDGAAFGEAITAAVAQLAERMSIRLVAMQQS